VATTGNHKPPFGADIGRKPIKARTAQIRTFCA
jgi:hypothetical protein